MEKDPRKSALPRRSNRKWMIKIWREIGLLDITEQKKLQIRTETRISNYNEGQTILRLKRNEV